MARPAIARRGLRLPAPGEPRFKFRGYHLVPRRTTAACATCLRARFAAKIPPVQTPIHGLQIADTCFYYPEDRGISENVRIGEEMAERV